MDKVLQDAIDEISRNHRQIIEDWCKAYMAELYEAGVQIKPGCFTLNEQHLDNVGGSVLGKKYWFEFGKPDYSQDGWIKISEKSVDENRIHFLTDGKTVFIKGTVMQPFLIQLYGEYTTISEFNPIYWMSMPMMPKEDLE